MTTLPVPDFQSCRVLAETLEYHEYKPSVTLVRHGIIPDPRDKTLMAQIPRSLFVKLYNTTVEGVWTLRPLGRIFFGVSTRPAISSLLISLILAQIPSLDEIETSKIKSVSKELSVMESVPRSPAINWEQLFNSDARSFPLACTTSPNPKLHKTILRGLYSLRDSYDLKLIWPYSTRRGVSTETAQKYLSDNVSPEPWLADDKGPRIISSRDIVARFLHYGRWVSGDCEMKQKWYSSGLSPRTYFAQGGTAIRVSCYLRDFFNELCDCFIPTNRFDRVNPNRLVTYHNGFFFIYDLTSFTSNFHEQGPFLDALSDFFSGVIVFLVGVDLTLTHADLGSLISLYRSEINTNPRYRISERIFEHGSLPSVPLIHHVAGFLGVPGNLATCTFGHGVLIAQHTDSTNRQSCAGDDGNIAVRHHGDVEMVSDSIRLLGILQDEKGYSTIDGSAIYLKRQFVQEGIRGVIQERVEFVMLATVNAFRKPDPRYPEISEDRGRLRRSIAASVATLIRSLYTFTDGQYESGEVELIMAYLEYIYDVAELPKGGEIRGIVVDDSQLVRYVKTPIVFPLDSHYLTDEPDLLFSSQFCPWAVTVPDTTDTEIFDFHGDWSIGEERSCRLSGPLEKLVKYGWLSRRQVPRKTLIGPDAKKFFRRLLRDEIESLEYTYMALKDLTTRQLQELGIYEHTLGSITRPVKRRRFQHFEIFDPDDPVILSLNIRDPMNLASEETDPFRGALDTDYLSY